MTWHQRRSDMKKKMISMVMAAVMVVGCTGSFVSAGTTDSSTAETAAADAKDMKIGLLLSGSANDGGWSEMAADAAEAVEKQYGCTVDFSESVAATDYESVMRGYADAGYNIIVAHGAEFLDTTKTVAQDYPDLTFINTSASKDAMEDAPSNVTGIDFGTYALGYIAGVACGYASENGKIGAIGSNEISSIVAWAEGVEDGAKSVNPDAVVTATYTGSYDDQVKAKQCVDSLADNGCDTITENADACGIGAVQECDALGLMNIGNVADETTEGDSCMLSIVQDSNLGIQLAIADAVNGKLQTGYLDMGPVTTSDSAVTRLSDYSGKYANVIKEDEKVALSDLVEKYHNGYNLDALRTDSGVEAISAVSSAEE